MTVSRSKRFRALLLGSIGFILAGPVQNLNPAFAADFHSPRTVGLGNAGAAGPFINDAIYLNPSLVPLLFPAKSLSVNFQAYDGGKYPGSRLAPQGRVTNASFQDGSAPMFAAGVGYTLRDDGPILSIGASKSFFERTGFGLGYKIFIEERGDKPSGSDGLFSASVIAQDWLIVSLIVDNLFNSKAAGSRGATREIKLGTKSNIMEIMLIYFDPSWMPDLPDGRRFSYALGTEYPIFREIFLRVGMFKNSYIPFLSGRADGLGAGLAWVAPKLSLDYGFQRVLRSPEALPQAVAHTFGATIFF